MENLVLHRETECSAVALRGRGCPLLKALSIIPRSVSEGETPPEFPLAYASGYENMTTDN